MLVLNHSLLSVYSLNLLTTCRMAECEAVNMTMLSGSQQLTYVAFQFCLVSKMINTRNF